MMQTDVKSAYTASNAALTTTRTRIKGVFFAVDTAGASPVIFYDNASAASGTVLLEVSAAVAGAHNVIIPGEGILALNGVFVDKGSSAAVTLIYG